MGHSILVPWDGSYRSTSALRYAAALGSDGAVTALHTVAPLSSMADAQGQARDRFERKYERAHDRLEAPRRVASDRSTEFSAEFVYGHPVHAVLRYADLYTFDQIVVDRQYQPEADTIAGALGTGTETIVRRTDVPVTVTRATPNDEPIALPESVLVPFDGSVPSCNALRYAIATVPDATVHVLYVRYPFVDDLARPGVRSDEHPDFEDWFAAVREWHSRADRDAEDVLQIAESIVDGTAVDHRTAVESGYPPREILEYSEQLDPDHVVVGSHGRDHDGGTRALLGSVAQRVVRDSSPPVTIVQ